MTPEEAKFAEDWELRQAVEEGDEWARIELYQERVPYMEDLLREY